MKLLSILLGLAATGALCSPTAEAVEATVEDCGELGVMEWDPATLPEGTDISALRKCKKHPSELGIASPLYDPASETEVTNSSKRGDLLDEVAAIAKRGVCSKGGRGSGYDYDYGCDKGWCWRNCDGPFVNADVGLKKTWCWLAYESGNGGWTPCGRWQDCEWSYNNKAAKCGKGDCKACGCGC
ncbi:hypothetical protein COCVIDRAFT_23019 [Bipolaris victoriae FI3]|uniref:IDI-2 n=3 Tax=Bipolaris TaxID=33194 RepID=W6YDJ8_COCC2|nr:uncharacterized protein COCCADRAFT_95603 [Bipolaris zeicola 26-R-13]XP_014560743.1 hypothetical protein COCVIDRAFT_23019 [Bipolaris victoriae FI3]ABU68439.1 victoriocin [Bipolaris victoriae]EUC33609.1 hypothetical protein COCCADRAFT_95603 [Bipolaris zeicola 26-R-13]